MCDDQRAFKREIGKMMIFFKNDDEYPRYFKDRVGDG